MSANAQGSTILYPSQGSFDDFLQAALCPVFDKESLSFVDALSRKLMQTCRTQYPDLYALGYWFRQSHVAALKARFEERNSSRMLHPKGTLFQVSPGNVDIQFIYSALLALLTGNRIAIRLSSRSSEPLHFLLSVLNQLDEQSYQSCARRLLIFMSEHNAQAIYLLSGQCDLRLLWGSNDSIEALRSIPLHPKAKELTFPERHSACVINAQAVLTARNADKLISDFSRDVFSFSQQACSSPKVLYWVGAKETVIAARDRFWRLLERTDLPGLDQSAANSRLLAMQSIAMAAPVQAEVHVGPLLRLSLAPEHIVIPLLRLHSGGGLILETHIDSASLLAQSLPDELQTLSFFGFARTGCSADQLLPPELGTKVDRLVSIGRAVEFDVVWDGYDLLQEFCRVAVL